MGSRIRDALAIAGITAAAAMLSALLFAAFLAPSWPRTAWGWAISAALGLPLLVAARMIIALCFVVGPPRFNFGRRGDSVLRYHAGSRGAQSVLLAFRVMVAAGLCGLLLWGVYSLVTGVPVLRTQFR